MWEIIHDEAWRADRTMTLYHNRSESGQNAVLFEVNVQGLYISYYGDALDAVNNSHRLTQICYGWDVLMSENDQTIRDAFFASTLEGRLGDDGCAHFPYTCDQVFHAAQVLLNNEECDGCEVCEWSETIHVPDAYRP